MKINKVAQVIFTNESALLTILSRIKSNEIDIYIQDLSQVHENLVYEKSLEDSIASVADNKYGASQLKSIISAIGESNFSSSEFSDISESIKKIHSEATGKLPVPLVANPVTPLSPSPGDLKVDGPPDPSDIVNMNDEDRASEVMKMKELIPASLNPISKNKATFLYKNIELNSNILSSNRTPDNKKYKFRNNMLDGILTLFKIIEDHNNGLDEEEAATAILPLSSIFDRGENNRKKKEEEEERQNPEDHHYDSGRSKLNVSRKNINKRLDVHHTKSIIDEDEVNDNLGIGAWSVNPYVDYTDDGPVFLDRKAQDVFFTISGKIQEISKKVTQLIEKGEGPDFNTKRELNDLMYAAKKTDYEAMSEFMKYKKDSSIPKELIPKYEAVEKKLNNFLPTKILINSFQASEIRGQFLLSSMYLSSPAVTSVVHSARHREAFVKKKMITAGELDESRQQEVLSIIERNSSDTTDRKIKEYFDLRTMLSSKNFLSTISLSLDTIYLQSKQDLNGDRTSVTLRLAPCPVCFKYIPYSGKKYSKVKITSPLVSFYRDREIDGTYKITLDYLKSRPWPLPPLKLYRDQREKEIISKYSGEKTWDQISDLISSSVPKEYEEGIHRRAGALFAAGGAIISPSISVDSLKFSCPTEEYGGCGIELKKVNTTLPPELSLQPEWNAIRTKDKKVRNSEYTNSISASKSPEKNIADKMSKPGPKFSRVSFSCTCHIEDFQSVNKYSSGVAALSKVGPSGTEGFVNPTDHTGKEKVLPEGTLLFSVCGAPASISMFDRRESSNGYILKYLRDIRRGSVEKYAAMVNILIRYGIGVDNMMLIDQSLDQYTSQDDEIDLNKISSRVNKILGMIKSSSVSALVTINNDLERELISGLNLVCPLGHTFNIGHSMKFAKANAGLNIVSSQSKYSPVSAKAGVSGNYMVDLLNSYGKDNIKKILRTFDRLDYGTINPDGMRGVSDSMEVLVPASDPRLVSFTILPYAEWSKLDDGVLFPDAKNPERPVLSFTLPIDETNAVYEDFVFIKGFSNKGNSVNIWNANGSSTGTGGIISEYYLETSSIKYSGEESAVAEDKHAVDLFEQGEADEREGDFFSSGLADIPISVRLTNESSGAEIAEAKMKSFARLIESSIRLIRTWTDGVIDDAMINSILDDAKVDVKKYSFYLKSKISGHIDFYNSEDPDIEVRKEEPEIVSGLISAFMMKFEESLSDKCAKLYDWTRSNIYTIYDDEDFAKGVAKKIISASLKDVSNEWQITPTHTGYLVPPSGKAKDIEEFIKKLSSDIIDENSEFYKELTLISRSRISKNIYRSRGFAKIALINYAQHVSDSLSSMYAEFCADEKSLDYIGYDIGIDLSNSKKIMGYPGSSGWVAGYGKNEVDSIVSTVKEANKNGQLMGLSGMMNSEGAMEDLVSIGNIDKAWSRINISLASAKVFAASPRVSGLSNQYLADRLELLISNSEGSLNQNVRSNSIRLGAILKEVSNASPTSTMSFSGTIDSPESGGRHLTVDRLPRLSKKDEKKGLNFLSKPGMRVVQEGWIVREMFTNEDEESDQRFKSFATEEEAVNFANSLAHNDHEVFEASYYKNPRYNFNSSKLQIGMFDQKNAKDMSWPPSEDQFNFVNIILPFDPAGGSESKMSLASRVAIPSYKFVIDFDGEPLDISFLMRVDSKSDTSNSALQEEISGITDLKYNEEQIIAIKKTYEKQMEDYVTNQTKLAIGMSSLDDKELKEDFKAGIKELQRLMRDLSRQIIEESKPFLRQINSKNLSVFSGTNHYNARTGSASRMLSVSLLDPVSAYRIIENPETRGVTLSAKKKHMYKAFVVSVYKLDVVASVISKAKGKEVTPEDIISEPEKFRVSVNSSTSKELMEVYSGAFGRFYDVIPDESGKSEIGRAGSYLQYIKPYSFSSSPRRKHPVISDLISAANIDKSIGFNTLFNSGNQDEPSFADKIESEALQYIRQRTSNKRENPAHDKNSDDESSEYSNKIKQRKSKVEGIILSLGVFDESEVRLPNF